MQDAVQGVTRDVTELRRLQDRLAALALRDPLTGLANRSLFADRIDHALARVARDETAPVLLLIDLDGFKAVNDVHGHLVGDELLTTVAQRLAAVVRPQDTVARLGGDEFVILADGLGRADAQDLAVRLRNEIIQPIRAEGRAVRVGASFGIGWAHCGMTADEVLKSADERMYVEKRSRPKQHRRAG